MLVEKEAVGSGPVFSKKKENFQTIKSTINHQYPDTTLLFAKLCGCGMKCLSARCKLTLGKPAGDHHRIFIRGGPRLSEAAEFLHVIYPPSWVVSYRVPIHDHELHDSLKQYS